MLRKIVFTQNELVEMLQGKTVDMTTKLDGGYLFHMEEKPAQDYTPLTGKETEDLMGEKVTVNQLREAHGLRPAEDISLDILLMQNHLMSPDDFLKKHGFLRMSDVFDILLDDFINSEKEKNNEKTN